MAGSKQSFPEGLSFLKNPAKIPIKLTYPKTDGPAADSGLKDRVLLRD